MTWPRPIKSWPFSKVVTYPSLSSKSTYVWAATFLTSSIFSLPSPPPPPYLLTGYKAAAQLDICARRSWCPCPRLLWTEVIRNSTLGWNKCWSLKPSIHSRAYELVEKWRERKALPPSSEGVNSVLKKNKEPSSDVCPACPCDGSLKLWRLKIYSCCPQFWEEILENIDILLFATICARKKVAKKNLN